MTTPAKRVKELRAFQAEGRKMFFDSLRRANRLVSARYREIANNPRSGGIVFQSAFAGFVLSAYSKVAEKMDEWGQDMVVRVARGGRDRAAADIKAHEELNNA